MRNEQAVAFISAVEHEVRSWGDGLYLEVDAAHVGEAVVVPLWSADRGGSCGVVASSVELGYCADIAALATSRAQTARRIIKAATGGA